jgi:hypothetical protein
MAALGFAIISRSTLLLRSIFSFDPTVCIPRLFVFRVGLYSALMEPPPRASKPVTRGGRGSGEGGEGARRTPKVEGAGMWKESLRPGGRRGLASAEIWNGGHEGVTKGSRWG